MEPHDIDLKQSIDGSFYCSVCGEEVVFSLSGGKWRHSTDAEEDNVPVKFHRLPKYEDAVPMGQADMDRANRREMRCIALDNATRLHERERNALPDDVLETAKEFYEWLLKADD